MLLHALSLNFVHPTNNVPIGIEAPLQPEFERMINLMGWQDIVKDYTNPKTSG